MPRSMAASRFTLEAVLLEVIGRLWQLYRMPLGSGLKARRRPTFLDMKDTWELLAHS